MNLYVHFPFCRRKCAYCALYSLAGRDKKFRDGYALKIADAIRKISGSFKSVYFGGGTPSLIGSDNIAKIMGHIKRTSDCEATLECNPSDTGSINSDFNFSVVAKSGINRISMGLQSADNYERKILGRFGFPPSIIPDVKMRYAVAARHIKPADIANS